LKALGKKLAVFTMAGLFSFLGFRVGVGLGQLSVCEVPEDVSLFEKISKDVYKANYKVSEVEALCGSEFVGIIKDLE
jgi:hypothetical protein